MRNIKDFDGFAVNESQQQGHAYIVGDGWHESYAYDVFDNEPDAQEFLRELVEEKFDEELRDGMISVYPEDFEDEEEYLEAEQKAKQQIEDALWLEEYDLSDPERTAQAFDMIMAARQFGPADERQAGRMIKRLVSFGADIRNIVIIETWGTEWLMDELSKIASHDREIYQMLLQVPEFERHARKLRGAKMFGV